MAIAFDSKLNFSVVNDNTGSPHSIAFTNTGGNFVALAIMSRQGNNDVTSVSYGGSAMTQSYSAVDASTGWWWYVYTLIGAATGTNNFSIAYTNTTNDKIILAISYSGMPTGSSVGPTTTTTSGSANTITTTLTPTHSNGWSLLVAINNGANVTAGTGSTLRTTASTIGWFDSNGIITNGSPYSMTVNSTATNLFVGVMLAFAPPAAATTNAAFLLNLI